MAEPWQKDLAQKTAAQLEDVRSWLLLILPLSAFACAMFTVALCTTGASPASACAGTAALCLTWWAVSLSARQGALEDSDGK